jgi:purine-nucleoside phosphorylase
VAVVLGSGWVPAADLLGTTVAEFAVTDLDYFAPPSVEGHAGRVRSVDADGTRVLVFLGRTHLYEQLGVDAVTHAARTAALSGCSTIVLTNGCGGLDSAWIPGTPVLIRDHINLTGHSPLHGAHFVDLTDLYSARLRALCKGVDPHLDEGVYAQFPGPMYETPAEIQMVRAIGGSLVGMSTALEAIVSRAMGMEVLGLSLVTNLAAGMTGEPLNHEEVLETGRAAATRMGSLLGKVIREL